MVRGKDVVQAVTMLKFVPNYAAQPVSKLLISAIANAEENFGVSRDDLYVYRIYADEAPPANGGALDHVADLCPGYDAHHT